MSQFEKTSRRSFVKGAFGMASVLITGISLFSKQVFGEAATPKPKVLKLMDEEKNKTAKSLKFMHDGSKSPDRKNAAANCGNCQMYRKKGEVEGVEVGQCNMIPGGYVKITGWCTSWARDPKKLKS